MKLLNRITLLVMGAVFFMQTATAQNVYDNPGDYMDFIGKANEALSQKYLSYLSAMSHGKSARKVDKRREEVLNAIYETRVNVQGLPPFKGDRTLRDTTVAYLKLLNSVFNEDYAKIVNMEEIAEQSYDAMEAYMLAQEKASEKLEQASEKQRLMQKQFAAKNNVTLIQAESEIGNKMKVANAVQHHYNEVYLVFFKSYKQEAYLMDAINKGNVISIEQNLSSLQKFATEGKEKLKDLKGYNSDPSLITACNGMLDFYLEETGKGALMTDFFLKQENFNKLKKTFESKPASKRTQTDVDQFNNAVNEINKVLNDYNATNKDLNKKRETALKIWNNNVKNYMDTYIPVQRK
jgi:hypothetical protein